MTHGVVQKKAAPPKKLNLIQRLLLILSNAVGKRKLCWRCGRPMFWGYGYRGFDRDRWTCPECHT